MKINSCKILLLPFSIFLFCLSIKSETNNRLFISSVRKVKENEFEVVLNEVILIREIKLHKIKIDKKEVLEIELPKYTSSDGKEYYQVRILSDNFYDEIKKCITENKTETLKFDSQSFPSFKINKFLPYSKKNSKLKINASVVFDDVLEIDCKIVEDNYDNIYILWPSEKIDKTNKWIKKVEFLSNPYQKIIEKQLINKYKVYRLEKGI